MITPDPIEEDLAKMKAQQAAWRAKREEELASFPKAKLTEVLESVPLHATRLVAKLFADPPGRIDLPAEIEIHCDDCGGVRRYSKPTLVTHRCDPDLFVICTYTCVNCEYSTKVFGLKCSPVDSENRRGICTKIYEEPAFGQPIPPRLFRLIGEENREHFLNARRAAARGLGIGAYAYYRRIVENHKLNLVSSFLDVAKSNSASSEQIAMLERAAKETQFSKAISIVGEATTIPPVLLIDGHNPLSILHDLLSEGIHVLTDEECLERAQQAEVILVEIAARIQLALTEKKAVKEALSKVIARKAQTKPGAA